MPNEQYLDTYGLNTFWSQVKSYIDANGGTDIAPGILLYASVAEPIQKNHSTTMTKSGFVGPLPKVNDAGYGLLTYDKKLYQVAYRISSIDSDGLYTIIYDGDPLLVGPSESGGGGSTGASTFLVKAPIGTIVIWSGTVDNIPTGWQFCDGTNGTPDLRDKFVLGAGPSHAVGSSGGEETVTLTTAQMPQHSHQTSDVVNIPGTVKAIAKGSDIVMPSNKYASTNTNGGGAAHNNMPPYYTLCYIMKLTADPTDSVTQEELTAALADKQDTLVNGTGTTVENNAVNINTPVQGIKTQAEFNALPESEQNKGLWVISDGGSGGSSSGGEIYSTEETRIGTWIDGKPLYRIVITGYFPSNTNTTNYYDIPNVDKQTLEVKHIYGTFSYSGEMYTYPIGFWWGTAANNANSQYRVEVFYDRLHGISVVVGGTFKNSPFECVLEYTKTTDEATIVLPTASLLDDSEVTT